MFGSAGGEPWAAVEAFTDVGVFASNRDVFLILCRFAGSFCEGGSPALRLVACGLATGRGVSRSRAIFLRFAGSFSTGSSLVLRLVGGLAAWNKGAGVDFLVGTTFFIEIGAILYIKRSMEKT